MANNKKSSESKSKRNFASFKDVQIAYLLDGIAGIEKLFDGRKPNASVLRRALVDLRAQGRAVDSLEAYVEGKFGMAGRGRSMPHVGEERKYRAQQINDGGAFLRLPLTPLGGKKGSVVRVRFEADRIIVTKD